MCCYSGLTDLSGSVLQIENNTFMNNTGSTCSKTVVYARNNQANERGDVLAIIGSSLFISGDNRLEDNVVRLGEIASACNTQISTLSLPALARPDSVQPQCTLYDHSDTINSPSDYNITTTYTSSPPNTTTSYLISPLATNVQLLNNKTGMLTPLHNLHTLLPLL